MYGPMFHALYGEVETSDAYNATFTFPGQLASAAPLVVHGSPLLRQIRGTPFQCGRHLSDGTLCYADPLDTSTSFSDEQDSAARD